MKGYEKDGVLTEEYLMFPSKKQLEKGVAFIECVQEIPCDPCVDGCPVGAISMKNINAPPLVDYDKCICCGKCISVCPGLAIFVIKIMDGKALVSLPYEFLPVPDVDSMVKGLDRKGDEVCDAKVKKISRKGRTFVVTVEVDEDFAMDVRNIQV